MNSNFVYLFIYLFLLNNRFLSTITRLYILDFLSLNKIFFSFNKNSNYKIIYYIKINYYSKSIAINLN